VIATIAGMGELVWWRTVILQASVIDSKVIRVERGGRRGLPCRGRRVTSSFGV
jgi:hypothetical protein